MSARLETGGASLKSGAGLFESTEESVELAAELDLNDKKSFFLKEGFSQIMKSASLNYKLEGKITFKMVGMACKSIVYRHYPDDSE